MFALIITLSIVLVFTVLAMVLDHADKRSAFTMHMACAGEPVDHSQRARNEVLMASLHNALHTPEARYHRALRAAHSPI